MVRPLGNIYKNSNVSGFLWSSFIPLMDDLNPTQALLFSCARRLYSGHTGALIRVRRSSDNAELDIGYMENGSLDTTALLTFVGSGTGYIAALYSQNGNTSDDLIQPTAGNQPVIVTSGVLNTNGAGKPEMVFNGVDRFLERRSVATFTETVIQIAGVIRPSVDVVVDVGHGAVFSFGAGTVSQVIQYLSTTGLLPGDTVCFSNSNGSHAIGSNSTSLWTAGKRLAVTYNSASSNSATYNGTAISYPLLSGSGVSGNYTPSGNPNLTSTNNARFAMGASRTASTLVKYFSGGISELVVYKANNTSNLATVTANQTTYYGV
jgi:hypothetical protein